MVSILVAECTLFQHMDFSNLQTGYGPKVSAIEKFECTSELDTKHCEILKSTVHAHTHTENGHVHT